MFPRDIVEHFDASLLWLRPNMRLSLFKYVFARRSLVRRVWRRRNCNLMIRRAIFRSVVLIYLRYASNCRDKTSFSRVALYRAVVLMKKKEKRRRKTSITLVKGPSRHDDVQWRINDVANVDNTSFDVLLFGERKGKVDFLPWANNIWTLSGGKAGTLMLCILWSFLNWGNNICNVPS